MRIVITGGTGLIGRELCKSLLQDGHHVVVLTRNPSKVHTMPPAVTMAKWDGKSADGWLEHADGADAIINLAGENLAAGRWHSERKRKIYASRVEAGKAVVEAVTAAKVKPKVVIQASGIDFYGPRGDEIVTEADGPGSDFLAVVCFDWEASTAPVEAMGVRRPILRTSIVLTTQGGALPKVLLPFRFFGGGPLGSGRQYWPWIHIADEVRAILFLLEHESATGPFNLCAPDTVTNKEFANTVGKVMGRPALMPAPEVALKLVLGEMSAVVLNGRRAIPMRLQELGFTFSFPTLESALRDILR
jgi:uncharacterized protein